MYCETFMRRCYFRKSLDAILCRAMRGLHSTPRTRLRSAELSRASCQDGRVLVIDLAVPSVRPVAISKP